MNGAIFIDGASWAISFTEQAPSAVPLRLDYEKLIHALAREISPDQIFQCPHRFYYSTYRGLDTRATKRAFFREIKKANFIIEEFQAKQYADGHYEDKGVDIALALDAYRLAHQGEIDTLIRGTHDTDFVPLFERLPGPLKVVVVGWKKQMGSELVQAARTVYLDDIWDQVRYDATALPI